MPWTWQNTKSEWFYSDRNHTNVAMSTPWRYGSQTQTHYITISYNSYPNLLKILITLNTPLMTPIVRTAFDQKSWPLVSYIGCHNRLIKCGQHFPKGIWAALQQLEQHSIMRDNSAIPAHPHILYFASMRYCERWVRWDRGVKCIILYGNHYNNNIKTTLHQQQQTKWKMTL